jgi:hypothetical protein
MSAARESLNLRVSPELKRQVEGYAEFKGISVNAAAIRLLTDRLFRVLPHPCDAGRCPDPVAHAEGAHDL